MIRISTRTMYGLRAIIYIGLRKDEWPISLSDIAFSQNIPIRYIEQIFIKFRKSGIIKSYRGVAGGYILREDFENLTLLDIVEAADGKIITAWCLDPKSKRKCYIFEDCILVDVWRGLGRVIEEYLSSIKLGELLKKANDTDFIKLFFKIS